MPIYNAPDLARRSIESLEDVDKYLVCNSREEGILELYNRYGGCKPRHNNYCNPSWNRAMKYFLEGKWQWLVLGCSDVILHEGWGKLLELLEPTKEVYVPSWINSLEEMMMIDHDLMPHKTELKGGVAGAIMFLPREAVEIVYPIPKGLKLWFGDEYIFTKLRNRGYKVMQLDHLFAYHFVSVAISANPDSERIIEGDKGVWAKLDEKVLK